MEWVSLATLGRRARGRPEEKTKFEVGEMTRETYRFAGFTLDLTSGRLLRGSSEIALRRKAFEFLHLLVAGRGRLFSKDELIDALWPDVIASEDSLVQLVTAVRSALGPVGKEIIVTAPKRGYRLGAAVEAPAPQTKLPDVHYAASGDIRIAYQVIGDGPNDLIYVPGWVSHLDYGWEAPLVADFYRQLASFSRLILFDKRGTGLSDRAYGLPTIEQRMDDVRAVLDAAGSRKAAILAMSEGGGMAISFAAAFPERTSALMLFGVFAKREWSPDYPWAPTREARQLYYDDLERNWGGPLGIENIAPGLSTDDRFRSWWATYQRRSASPAAALALARMNTQIDVRHLLPSIAAPTLVMHRINDRETHIDEAHYIASRVPSASLLELPGDDHLIYAGRQTDVIEPVRQFMAEHC
jgi:DNA-binding winged helix-turn-helix (wHTH) protein/pimeloyl-ACP methyl ester carboxylesterase